MADLTGYTAMTHVHGGESAAKIVRKYMQLVDGSLVGSSKVIQRIGDQVVIIAPSAADILSTSQRLVQIANDEHQFLAVHVGLHYGSVFMEENNLFGSTINIASRIMNMAQGSQVLCSQVFLSQLPDFNEFTSVGFHKLKNVVEEFELFELASGTSLNKFLKDPVCHMQIDPTLGDYTYIHNQHTYHFCSDHCRTLFKAAPGSFISDM